MYFVQKMREIKDTRRGVEGNVASIEEKKRRKRREEERDKGGWL